MKHKNHYETVVDLFKSNFGDREILGIEIGTGGAVLTKTILENFPKCTLYTMDSWEHRDGEEFEAGGYTQEHHLILKNMAVVALSQEQFNDRVHIFHMKSEDAIVHMPKEVDFVWIDGDHSDKGITTDLELYTSLVKPGGIIGGHDFGLVAFVTNAVMKKFGTYLNSGNEFTWWVFA